MLNRSALIVRPAKPFLDWIAAFDDAASLPNPGDEQTVYLITDFESESEQRQVLQEVFAEVFVRELRSWHTDETAWPKRRTFMLFRQWFVIEMHSVVEDLAAFPLDDDERDGRA